MTQPYLERDMIEQHSLDMRQFVGFRQSTLPNGLRIIDAYNASGLRYAILPDRGLDIWTADFCGIPLTWVAPGSPFAPDFGQKWLAQFNGGLLTTCGLLHVGPPEHDEESGGFRDLHGWYTRLRANELNVQAAWEGCDYLVRLSGDIHEGFLHGYHFQLRRTYEISLSAPEIRIHDHITNTSDTPTPLMLLYHFNMGYPVMREGASLITSGDMPLPRNDDARDGMAQWATYDAASPGRVEQVFFHRVRQSNGHTTAALISDDQLALSLHYSADKLPYLTQWKNMRHGMYVTGIEPGNCIPEGLNAAQKSGRQGVLQPGETYDIGQITLAVHQGAQAVTALRDRIDMLHREGSLVVGFHI